MQMATMATDTQLTGEGRKLGRLYSDKLEGIRIRKVVSLLVSVTATKQKILSEPLVRISYVCLLDSR